MRLAPSALSFAAFLLTLYTHSATDPHAVTHETVATAIRNADKSSPRLFANVASSKTLREQANDFELGELALERI